MGYIHRGVGMKTRMHTQQHCTLGAEHLFLAPQCLSAADECTTHMGAFCTCSCISIHCMQGGPAHEKR